MGTRVPAGTYPSWVPRYLPELGTQHAQNQTRDHTHIHTQATSHTDRCTHTRIHHAAVVSHLVIVAEDVSQEEPRFVFRAPGERLRLPVNLDSDLTAQLLRTRLDRYMPGTRYTTAISGTRYVCIYSIPRIIPGTLHAWYILRRNIIIPCLVAVRSKKTSKLSCLRKVGTTAVRNSMARSTSTECELVVYKLFTACSTRSTVVLYVYDTRYTSESLRGLYGNLQF